MIPSGQINGVAGLLGSTVPVAPTSAGGVGVTAPVFAAPARYEMAGGPALQLMAIERGNGSAGSSGPVGCGGAGSPGGAGGNGGSDDATIELGGRRFASLEEMARIGGEELRGQIKAEQLKMILSSLGFSTALGVLASLHTPPILILGAAIYSAWQISQFFFKRRALIQIHRFGHGFHEYSANNLTTPIGVYEWLTSLRTSANYYTNEGSVGMGGGLESFSAFAGFGEQPGDLAKGLQVKDETSGRVYNFVALMGRDTVEEYFRMAERSPRGAEILRILAQHNRIADDPERVASIQIKWKDSELEDEPGYSKGLEADTVEWLASKGNRPVVEWVCYHSATRRNEKAQEIWAHLTNVQEPAVKKLVEGVVSARI